MRTYEIMGRTVERYSIRLFRSIESLHCHVTGSCDMLLAKEARFHYLYLKARLEDWNEPIRKQTKKYELAFRSLVEAAIEEYEDSWLYQHDLDEI